MLKYISFVLSIHVSLFCGQTLISLYVKPLSSTFVFLVCIPDGTHE